MLGQRFKLADLDGSNKLDLKDLLAALEQGGGVKLSSEDGASMVTRVMLHHRGSADGGP